MRISPAGTPRELTMGLNGSLAALSSSGLETDFVLMVDVCGLPFMYVVSFSRLTALQSTCRTAEKDSIWANGD